MYKNILVAFAFLGCDMEQNFVVPNKPTTPHIIVVTSRPRACADSRDCMIGQSCQLEPGDKISTCHGEPAKLEYSE